MDSNTSCFITPPLSPILATPLTTNEVKQNVLNKETTSGCVYPNYKRKQPHNLRIRTSNLSINNNKIVGNTSATSLYQKINGTSVSEPQETSQSANANVSPLTSEQYMEKVMENTSLICSFLKTICVGIPIDENNERNSMPSPSENEYSGSKKAKYASLENFVANILIRTKLTDTFVYVALLFANRYLNSRLNNEKAKKMNAIASLKNSSNICHKKNMATKITSRTHTRHSISKGNHKKKLNEQSIKYLYQQSKKDGKDESKRRDSIVDSKSFNLSKESLIKTQKDVIFAAMICSSKYLDDNSYCNTAWVKLTDKSLKEVSDLEREFLVTIQYELYFSQEEWKEWFVWISHFKELLDAGLTSNEDVSSPSSVISVPSQSPVTPYYSYGQVNQVFPSPVDVQTPVFADVVSPIYSEEEIEEEKIPLYYPSNTQNILLPSETQNVLLPPLSELAPYDEYYTHQRILPPLNVTQYANSSSQYSYSCYPVASQYLKPKMEESISYEVLMDSRKNPYLPCQSMEMMKNNKPRPSLINTINTSLLDQAQNTPIDYNVVQKLSQKGNIIFKIPVLSVQNY